MCMYVSKVLLDSGILVYPVYKHLIRLATDSYITFFQNTPVPKDGVLRPNGYIDKSKIKAGKSLSGGCIHSYLRPKPPFWNAFALIPIAAGSSYMPSLVSRALYIPELDRSDLKEKRMKLLRGPKENITIQSLTRLFALEGVDLDDYYDSDDED